MATVREPADLPELGGLPIEAGTRVLLRADLNVLLEGGEVTDDRTLRAGLPTLETLRDRGATVVVCGHLGPHRQRPEQARSLQPVADRLGELAGTTVRLCPDPVGTQTRDLVDGLDAGEVVLLENLHRDRRERDNDPAFATALADLAGVYVNDAFPASHLSWASIVGVPALLPGAAGHRLAREVAVFSRLRDRPAHPSVAVVGGVDVADRLDLIEVLADHFDAVCVGGALPFTFFAAQGWEAGDSLVDHSQTDRCRPLLDDGTVRLPTDVRVRDRLDPEGQPLVVAADDIPPEHMGLDIGPATAEAWSRQVQRARTVLWTGTVGAHEVPEFRDGSRRLAEALAACEGTTVVADGGIEELLHAMDLQEQVTHICPTHDAAFTLLRHGTLPGLDALRATAAPRHG